MPGPEHAKPSPFRFRKAGGEPTGPMGWLVAEWGLPLSRLHVELLAGITSALAMIPEVVR